jgi:outer membrane lipoprotein carrier protein
MRSPFDSAATLQLALAVLLVGVPSLAGGAGESTEIGAGDVPCDDARAKVVAGIVQRRYDAMTGLAADFDQSTQSVVLSVGASELGEASSGVSSGQVIFAKPGRMRWEYRVPEESYVISDGQILWIHDVAANQATRVPVGEEYLTGAALQFLLGEGNLSEAFVISAGKCSPGLVELDLKPRKPASYERLSMTAAPDTGLISETSIVDLFGNRTRIRFQNIVVDPIPASGAFKFVPPPGVEILDLSESN